MSGFKKEAQVALLKKLNLIPPPYEKTILYVVMPTMGLLSKLPTEKRGAIDTTLRIDPLLFRAARTGSMGLL